MGGDNLLLCTGIPLIFFPNLGLTYQAAGSSGRSSYTSSSHGCTVAFETRGSVCEVSCAITSQAKAGSGCAARRHYVRAAYRRLLPFSELGERHRWVQPVYNGLAFAFLLVGVLVELWRDAVYGDFQSYQRSVLAASKLSGLDTSRSLQPISPGRMRAGRAARPGIQRAGSRPYMRGPSDQRGLEVCWMTSLSGVVDPKDADSLVLDTMLSWVRARGR